MLPPLTTIFAFALAAIWLPVLYLLSPQWSIYEQYSYGWAVPALCLFLAWQRWHRASIGTHSTACHSSPPPAATPGSPLSAPRSLLPAIRLSALCSLLFLLLPLRILQEANPLWRLASYALAADVIALTLVLAHLAGGTRALKAFAFPVCFFLIAVPWPTPVETFVVQGLTRFNTASVTEIINAFGIPALAHGNIIEVGTGRLGVEEACSGIRSVQAVLMIALFFGELYHLALRRRIGLLIGAFASAIALNILRTTILVWIAAHKSVDTANRWHDTTGMVVLVSCFAAVWLIARLLRAREIQSPSAPAAVPLSFTGIRPSLLFTVIALAALSVVATELWFRLHERAPSRESWSISLPKDRTRFREVPLNAEVRGKLQFDAADSAMWQNPDGTIWQLFHFRWNPATRLKDRVRVQLAKSHRPEICLPASGWQLRQESAHTLVEVSGEPLLFRTYDFSTLGRTVFVFFCVREDATPSTAVGNMRETHAARWRAAWQGNRGLGQRVIEVAIAGADNLAEARASLTRELPRLIHIESR